MNNKKHMINIRINYVLLLFAATILIAGCSNANKNQPQQNNPQGDSQGQNQRGDSQRGTGLAFEGDPGSVEDLVIGQHVVISGSVSSGGNVTASSIRIGEFNPDENFQGLEGQNNPDAPQRFQGDNGTPPEGFSPPEGFDPEEFQNLSEEERRARFEEMRAQGNFPEGGNFGPGAGAQAGGSGRVGGFQIVQGEILAVDETTITIKLIDGGSKLVFYSGETRIVKQSTEQD